MPAAAFILLDGVTTTGLGYVLGINGEAMASGGAAVDKSFLIIPYEYVVTAIGGTATVQFQTGATVGTLATVGGNVVLASGQTWKFCGKTNARLVAMNVSAISGATVSAYIRLHANQV